MLPLTASAARFDAVPTPAGSSEIYGFAASGPTWVQVSGTPRPEIHLTSDRGRTWKAVAVDGAPRIAGVVVGPDAAFYVGATYPAPLPSGTYGAVLRIDPIDGEVSSYRSVPVPGPNSAMSPPAWDDLDRMWVAWRCCTVALDTFSPTTSGGTLARFDGHTIAKSYAVPAATGYVGEIRFLPSGLWLRLGSETYRLVGETLAVQSHGIPVHEEGGVQVSPPSTGGVVPFSSDRSSLISFDGGATTVRLGGRLMAVEGEPGLLAYDGWPWPDSWILRRYSEALWTPTGLALPPSGTTSLPTLAIRVLAVQGGFVAVADRSVSPGDRLNQSGLAYAAGPVPDSPSPLGPLSATTTSWLERLNAFRRQAGLPDAVGDAQISAAAENHSRYWTLNPAPDSSLSYHGEVPGRPGFTGSSLSDRCATAGTACSAEVMFPFAVPDPVGGWIVTPFHSAPLLTPGLVVGGGQVGTGPQVLNTRSGAGLVVGAIPFPVGRYDGPLWFAGEAPDPVVACQRMGQPIDWPVGTTISVRLPVGARMGSWSVRPVGGSEVRGCSLSNYFLPDDQLTRHTTYAVTATWQPTATAAYRTTEWTFQTGDGDGAPWATSAPPPPQFNGSTKPVPSRASGTCRSTITLPTRRLRRGRALVVRYHVCRRTSVRIRVFRIGKRGTARKPAVTRSATLGRVGKGSLRVSTRRLAPGRYRLQATLAIEPRAPKASTVTIVRPPPRRSNRR